MLDLLQAIIAGCAIFLAFLVGTVRQNANTVANRWLAAFLLLLGCFMLDDSLAVFGIYQQYPRLFGFAGLSAFALAPTLYLCVDHFVSVGKKFRMNDLWHFIPFTLFTLLSLPFLFANDAIKMAELANIGQPPQAPDKILLGLMLLQIGIYWIISFQKLQKHRRNIENISASPADVNLDWLLYLLYVLGGILIIWSLELRYTPLTANASWATPGYLLGICWLGYFALRQKEIYPFTQAESQVIGEIMAQNNSSLAAIRRPLFAEGTLDLLKTQLLEKMEHEKPYLDCDLSLPGLASQMQLGVHELSQLVNEGFNENFAQFINRYRVEESKRLLLSAKHAHLSMVGIAFEAGFNSKTAFNTAFKKMTGLAPSEFRSNHAASNGQ